MINSKSQTTIEGLDGLIKAFAALGDDAMQDLKIAADVAGEVVLAKAKQKAKGSLKNKLKLQKAKVKDGNYQVTSKVGTSKGTEYMVPLELGHKLVINGKTVGTVAEKPFLRPAAAESKDEVLKIISDAMKKTLEKMGGAK